MKAAGASLLLNRSVSPYPLGGGSFAPVFSPLQSQVDSLVGGFAETATDWRSLAAMMAGGMAYRIGRAGIMGLGSSALLHSSSIGVGLVAEVSTFELSHRALLAQETTRPSLWRWSGSDGIRQGIFQSFITFGTLRGMGGLARGENLVVRNLLQDFARVTGHQASGALGVTPRPSGTLAEQFLHAEALNL